MLFTQQEIDQALDRILNIAKANMQKEKQDVKNTFEKLSCKPKISKTKKPIPSTVRRLVWHTHIGEAIGKTKCLCCKTTEITQLSFHCGHVIPEAHGGSIHIDNLRPICQNCNSSMGTTNMNDFIATYKI